MYEFVFLQFEVKSKKAKSFIISPNTISTSGQLYSYEKDNLHIHSHSGSCMAIGLICLSRSGAFYTYCVSHSSCAVYNKHP